MDYLRQPEAIYAQSFATIRSEVDLSHLDADQQDFAVRLVHACGMVDIIGDLVITDGAILAGRAALAKGAPVICDVRMVAEGVIRRNLKAGNDVLSAVNNPAAAQYAKAHGTTRSAAGIEILADRIAGSIVAIGNAPTALFHLLERLQDGFPKPALILGFPVGFVGAIESKQALIDANIDVPFAALTGRRGGSALAAAAVNGVAVGLGT